MSFPPTHPKKKRPNPRVLRLAQYPGDSSAAKSPGKTTEDLGLKSSIWCMRQDRQWEFGAIDNKCSELINSAAIAKEGE